jgi:hypothetical protein
MDVNVLPHWPSPSPFLRAKCKNGASVTQLGSALLTFARSLSGVHQQPICRPTNPINGCSAKIGPMKPLISTPMLGCNTWICTILCVLASPRCAAPGAPASLPSGGRAARVLNSRLRALGGQRGQRWRSLARTPACPGRSQFRGWCRNDPWGVPGGV